MPIGAPSQVPDPKSACTLADFPMLATYADDLLCTGSRETSACQTLSAGRIAHEPDDAGLVDGRLLGLALGDPDRLGAGLSADRWALAGPATGLGSTDPVWAGPEQAATVSVIAATVSIVTTVAGVPERGRTRGILPPPPAGIRFQLLMAAQASGRSPRHVRFRSRSAEARPNTP